MAEGEGDVRMITMDGSVAGQTIVDEVRVKEVDGDVKRVTFVKRFILNVADPNPTEIAVELFTRKEAEEAEKK